MEGRARTRSGWPFVFQRDGPGHEGSRAQEDLAGVRPECLRHDILITLGCLGKR